MNDRNHHTITHRFDDAQLDKIINAISGLSAENQKAIADSLASAKALAAKADAADGKPAST